MFTIFYNENNGITQSADIKILDTLGFNDIIWIDLNNPTEDEKRKVESFLGTEIQSRAQAEEIESTSRYYESENIIFANTNFLFSQPHSYTSYDTVSFTLFESILITLHNADLRTLTLAGRRLRKNPHLTPTAYHLMVSILEQRVDLDADMLEGLAKEIAHLNKRASMGETISKTQLLHINQMQENTMVLRENIIDKQRVISSILRSNKFPDDLNAQLNFMIKDISSLINHTDFNFSRLEYLQNTLMGLINIEQNKIIKILTVLAIFFLPLTLVISILGINFENIPGAGWKYSYSIIIISMILVSVGILIYLKKKRLI